MNQDERYALAEEQKQIEWEAQFAGREAADYEKINQLLAEKKYHEIECLYEEEGFGVFYNGRSKFVGMNLAMKIYAHEKALENHVFWNVDSIEFLEKKIRKLRFCIWRAEYFGEEEIKDVFLQYMLEQRPSDWLLKYLISATALNEKKVMLGFARLMLEWNLNYYADSLVSYLEKR